MPTDRPYLEPTSNYWISFQSDTEVSSANLIEAIDQAINEPVPEVTDVRSR